MKSEKNLTNHQEELGLQYDHSYDLPKCEICGENLKIVLNTAFGIKIYPRCCKCKRDIYNSKIKIEHVIEKQTRIRRILSSSMMNNKLKDYTFEKWNHKIGNEKLCNIAKSYVRKFFYMKRHNQGMLIYGPPGNGKTYFSACIANKLIEHNIPTVCIGAIALTERINQSKRNWGEEGIFTVLNSLENADLLIIDDLGTEPDNKWTRAIMYQVIEKRNSTGLPLIITTNINMDELKERYDYRTYSRLTEMCSFIKNSGKDIRQIQGVKKTDDFLRKL